MTSQRPFCEVMILVVFPMPRPYPAAVRSSKIELKNAAVDGAVYNVLKQFGSRSELGKPDPRAKQSRKYSPEYQPGYKILTAMLTLGGQPILFGASLIFFKGFQSFKGFRCGMFASEAPFERSTLIPGVALSTLPFGFRCFHAYFPAAGMCSNLVC